MFPEIYQQFWLEEMRVKLGLEKLEEADVELINGLFEAMSGQGVDYTKMFRRLSEAALGDDQGLLTLFKDGSLIKAWLKKWLERISAIDNSMEEIAIGMNKANPVYIPRNHLVERALKAASKEADYQPFKKLLDVLMQPFEQRQGLEEYEEPAPKEDGPYITYCGT